MNNSLPNDGSQTLKRHLLASVQKASPTSQLSSRHMLLLSRIRLYTHSIARSSLFPRSHLYLILHHSMIRKSRKTYYIDGANKSKKKSTPGPDPMLPFVTILRLAALHIESGVVWCRNGMSDIRKKKGNNKMEMKKMKKKKGKQVQPKNQDQYPSVVFSSISTPARLVIMDMVLQSVPRFFY
ncbi:hypothetical protein M441DRAFT_241284 [Trichoderma asperellum CBS 433.97]|uniref:Uncharacterized protein n=1 Tax=Trichoderma asperellum (strain ATCC 204424 / CBS 433.97 / NBRC 101777) TaxID=1042311 RepID=A0A2T3Z281_TRIA4|nr:hypothetical protein M441DRAFT_241284 [Trichoderma asperellum CBS 433.97]PTB38921.1 hypothetical protein M441DRAFT_241284 [Trichoderma asperellum CBS 433.97]